MKLRIILKAYSNELVNLACEQLRSALLATNCEISGVVSLPTRIKRFCVFQNESCHTFRIAFCFQ